MWKYTFRNSTHISFPFTSLFIPLHPGKSNPDAGLEIIKTSLRSSS